MKDEIERRFRRNLERVRNIVALYEASTVPGPGRPSVDQADLLRAAVVFLHATLEDLMRGLAEWKLPEASGDVLRSVPLAGFKKDVVKFTLGDIAAFRGQGVEDVIQQSVETYLEKVTYNDPGQLKTALAQVGGDPTLVDAHANLIAAMMKRRHWIVHRADRTEMRGRGHHGARSIRRADVENWIQTVGTLGSNVLVALS